MSFAIINIMQLYRRKLRAPKLIMQICMVTLVILGLYLTTIFIKEFFWGQGYFRGTHYDFLAFYSAAQLTLHGQIMHIYDASSLTSLQHIIVPHAVGAQGYMSFLNPPIIAVFLSPLALLSVNTARLVWLAINLTLVGCVAHWIVRSIKGTANKLILALLLVASFPVYQNFIEGQLSLIILAGSLLGLWFSEHRKPVLSGMSLSVLLIKPQLAIMVGIGLIMFKQWRALLAMTLTSLVLIILALPITGIKLYFTYAHFLLGVTSSHLNGAGAVTRSVWEGTLKFSVGVNGMYMSLFGQNSTTLVNAFSLVTCLALVVLYILAIRKVRPGFQSMPKRMMLAASVMLILLIDPHAYAQDVVLVYVLIPILLPMRPQTSTILVILFFVGLIVVDQHFPIHLVTLSLVTFTVVILLDVILGYQHRRSIFNRFFTINHLGKKHSIA